MFVVVGELSKEKDAASDGVDQGDKEGRKADDGGEELHVRGRWMKWFSCNNTTRSMRCS